MDSEKFGYLCCFACLFCFFVLFNETDRVPLPSKLLSTSRASVTTPTTLNKSIHASTAARKTTLQPPVRVDRTELFTPAKYADIYSRMKPQPGDYNHSFKFNISGIFNTSRVTNEHKFNFIIKPKLEECDPSSQKKLLLLAVVMIGVGFEDKRQLIRSTWGNVTNVPDMKVIFAVALSRDNKTNEKLREEAQRYQDILQEDYIDDYFNITVKVIGAFKYFTENNCRVDRLMRINDDVVIKRGKLIEFLKSIDGSRNLIIGHPIIGVPPIRATRSKWWVRQEEFGGGKYFPYVEGSVFIVSSDLVRDMYQLSRYVYWPPFSISLEDVYIGMLCTHLQANYMSMRIEFEVGRLRPRLEPIRVNNLTAMGMVTPPRPNDLNFVIARDLNSFIFAWYYLNDP